MCWILAYWREINLCNNMQGRQKHMPWLGTTVAEYPDSPQTYELTGFARLAAVRYVNAAAGCTFVFLIAITDYLFVATAE